MSILSKKIKLWHNLNLSMEYHKIKNLKISYENQQQTKILIIKVVKFVEFLTSYLRPERMTFSINLHPNRTLSLSTPKQVSSKQAQIPLISFIMQRRQKDQLLKDLTYNLHSINPQTQLSYPPTLTNKIAPLL